MRPCEIRAFFELVKLKQGRAEDLLIVGIDCLGAFQNRDFFRWADENGAAATQKFYTGVLTKDAPVANGFNLAPACLVCEHPVPVGADIAIGFFGIDTDNQILVQAQTEKGEDALVKLALTSGAKPASRQKTVDQLIAEKTAARDRMLADTHAATDSLEALSGYLANCVNCYNCRVACPVCYCRECVFVTDVFDHEPYQYLLWANKKGLIKMPTDTLFYHITRLTHMSTACVGCGQCSNACPNDIPVMELFRTIANNTQLAFGYVAGRRLDERPPLSEFREEEFEEVVGISN
jgi:formate dehydrogenase subunit beta